jgi:hypothetical protein
MQRYVKTENNQIVRIAPRPNWLQDDGTPVTDAQLVERDWYPLTETQPEHDPATQKITDTAQSSWIMHADHVERTYQIIDKTPDERVEEFNAQAEAKELDQEVVKKLLQKQLEQMAVPDEEIDEYASLFPPFKVGETITQEMFDAGPIRRQYEGVVWQMIIRHTPQLDYLPGTVPNLWGRVHNPEVIPLWVRPWGAGDPNLKQTGDKVQWPDGTIWVSTIDNNTYEPGVYGWELDE